MKFSEKVDHLLRHYNYRRKRGAANNKSDGNFDMERYFGEVDSYIEAIIEGMDKFSLKGKG